MWSSPDPEELWPGMRWILWILKSSKLNLSTCVFEIDLYSGVWPDINLYCKH